MEIRIDKLLSNHNLATRSEAKKYIKQGLVTIDGVPVKKPEEKVNPQVVCVAFRGQPIVHKEFVYYMLNKPAGVVTATKDNLHRTVLDLIPNCTSDVFPVGRLDKDTTGLLILTNDGELCHQLMSPKKHVSKTYEATLDKPITADDISAFLNGLEYGEDAPAKPAILESICNEEPIRVKVTITEGKFHQVKRMFHAVGKEVLQLNRTVVGSLSLDDELALGDYRELTEEEVNTLKQLGGLNA